MSRPALAADRALQVIDLLALHPTERFNLTEISRRTGINSASAHALLSAMLRSGYVQRHPTHKTYALGPAVVAAGTAALEQLPGIRAAQAELARLSDELQLEVIVSTVTADEIIVVGSAPHASAYGAAMAVGQRLPLAPPLGTVFVAWSPGRAAEWFARALPALDDEELDQQRQVLGIIRQRGYSIAFESDARRDIGQMLARQVADRAPAASPSIDDILHALAHGDYQLTTLDPGATYDVSMIAAPIFDANREVTASLAASGFAPAKRGDELIYIGEHLLGAARVITKRTKGRLPPELD